MSAASPRTIAHQRAERILKVSAVLAGLGLALFLLSLVLDVLGAPRG